MRQRGNRLRRRWQDDPQLAYLRSFVSSTRDSIRELREKRDDEMLRLAEQGYSQRELMEALGLASPASVHRALLRAEARKEQK